MGKQEEEEDRSRFNFEFEFEFELEAKFMEEIEAEEVEGRVEGDKIEGLDRDFMEAEEEVEVERLMI